MSYLDMLKRVVTQEGTHPSRLVDFEDPSSINSRGSSPYFVLDAWESRVKLDGNPCSMSFFELLHENLTPTLTSLQHLIYNIYIISYIPSGNLFEKILILSWIMSRLHMRLMPWKQMSLSMLERRKKKGKFVG